MDIVIIDEDCTISVAEHFFLRFKTPEKDIVHRLAAIQSIQIIESTTLSTEVLKEISSYGIRLSLVDNDHAVIGEWYGNMANKSIQLKYKQMLCVANGIGYGLAAQWVLQKIQAQMKCLSSYGAECPAMQEKYHKLLLLHSSDTHDSVFNEEPILAKTYYEHVNSLLPSSFQFSRRSRQPSEDPYNAMINYAYSYLYRLVEDALVSQGLDPYLGFYHSNEKGGKALVFDFIEPFRPWVDERIIYLCLNNDISAHADFFYVGLACRISKATKSKLITEISTHFQEVIKHDNRILSRKNHIYYAAKKLKLKIQKHGKN